MKFLKFAILFIGLTSFAQSKVGTVDIDYILSQMPELKTVQEQVETYGKKLDGDLSKKVDGYKVLADEYKTGEKTFTDVQKKEKQTALITLETDIQKFQQNGTKLMEIRRNEFLKPLYTKIGLALDKVAKEGNYTQVLQTNNDIVYLDPELDLTLSIIQSMGIVIKKEE